MAQLEKICVKCGESVLVTATGAELMAYVCGALVQDAFPNMPVDHREMFISGVCGECFREMFPEIEEE